MAVVDGNHRLQVKRRRINNGAVAVRHAGVSLSAVCLSDYQQACKQLTWTMHMVEVSAVL